MRVSMLLLVCLFLLGIAPARAQNLVKNGSFEDYYSTPQGNGLLFEDFVKDWSSYITTPDYFNTVVWGVNNVLNYCHTLPRTGDGMAGGYVLGFFPPAMYNREYIQGDLTAPLKPNTLYYAEVYVRPWLKSPVINWAVEDIGIAFTDQHYTTLGSAPDFMIPEVPEVVNQSGALDNLSGWTKISGCFRAQGGETKLILGNFSIDSLCGKKLLPGATGNGEMSYYFFDDLSVIEIGPASITADTLICKDRPVTLSVFLPGAISWSWSNGGDGPTITVSEAGTYSVSVTTAEGCIVDASTTVTVRNCDPVEPGIPNASPLVRCPDIFLPDAFSPNNDGRNDMFRVISSGGNRLSELSIYNRWGERVFYTRDIGEGWDGKYKGVPADIGVYYYRLSYQDCYNGPLLYKKGDLTLVR